MLPKQSTSTDTVEPEPRDTAAPDRAVDTKPVVKPASAVKPEPAAKTEPVVKTEPAVKPTSAAKTEREVDPARSARVRLLAILAVAAVLLVAGAVLLAIANHATRTSGPLANEAFADTSGTAEVVGAMTAAVKIVYSYDYKTLDQNESAAKDVITGQFADEFDKVFTPVKQLAPKEQAVLTTAVPAAGVLQLSSDRARLLMMVDQSGTRAGGQPISGTSARLIVEAQRVDGRWKIAEVTPE